MKQVKVSELQNGDIITRKITSKNRNAYIVQSICDDYAVLSNKYTGERSVIANNIHVLLLKGGKS